MKIYNTRLFTLSLLVGLFAGVFGSAFRWLLGKTAVVRELMFLHDRSFLFHLLIILGMWGLALAIKAMENKIPLISGSGIPQSKGVIFGRYNFKKPWLQFVSKFTGSLGAIGMGLSLGREGPSVQIGTLGATIISKYFKTTPTEKRYLEAAGAGAGLSAAFTAPIASTIFLIEDTLGWVSLRVSLPALIACICAGYCAQIIIPENIYQSVPTIFPEMDIGGLFLLFVGFAILGTLGGKLFNLSLFHCKKWYKDIRIPTAFKLLVVVLITYIAGMLILDLTSGGETELIKQAITNDGNVWWLFAMVLIKIAFTAISYSTGLCGSLLLPLIVMGGLLGKGYALLLIQMGLVAPETTGFFTIIGMSIFFISVVRAPISGLMLVLEMTNQFHVFYPMIITGTLTFLFGQYLNITPVYHKLYNLMVNEDQKMFGEYICSDFKVSNDSVMIGKRIGEIKLPDNSRIEKITRGDFVIAPLPDDEVIHKGDLATVRLKSEDYERLFKVFRTLSDE